tara:strand:+ start:283 stop:558 length:276 start_codon:yes stop_codon:yes gene_type:complete
LLLIKTIGNPHYVFERSAIKFDFNYQIKMSKITVDGQEYDTDSLSDESKQLIQSLKFVKVELDRLNAQIAICKTAEVTYNKALKSSIEKGN